MQEVLVGQVVTPVSPKVPQGKAEDTRSVRLKEVGAAVGVAKATPGSLKVKEEGQEEEEPEGEAEEYEAEVGFLGMLEGEGEDTGKGNGEPEKAEGKGEEKKEKKKEGKGKGKGREEDAQEGSDDDSWGNWQASPGAGSSRDPAVATSGRARASAKVKAAGGTSSMTVGLRLLEGSLVSELQARQAELNRALADTGSDEDRARLMAQLDEVTNQLKELVAKRRQARSAPAGGWRTSARFSGRRPGWT